MSELTAEEVLKRAFANQLERVERALEIDKKLHALLPVGSKGTELLRRICEAVRKSDVAKVLKPGMDGAIHFSEDPSVGSGDRSEIAQKFSTLDNVDRNLIREVRSQIINIAKEQTNARYKTLEPDADAGRESKPSLEGYPETHDANVRRGA